MYDRVTDGWGRGRGKIIQGWNMQEAIVSCRCLCCVTDVWTDGAAIKQGAERKKDVYLYVSCGEDSHGFAMIVVVQMGRARIIVPFQ